MRVINSKISIRISLATCFFIFWQASVAQTVRVPLDQAVQQSLQNNRSVQSARYGVQSQQSLKRTSSDIGKLSVTGMFGQYNSYAKGDNNISVSQSIPFPTVFGARSALGNANIKSSELMLAATENELAYQVKSTWYQLAYFNELNKWYAQQDSLLGEFAEAAAIRQRTGETNLLEKVTAESRHLQAKTLLRQNEADIAIYRKRLQTLLNSATEPDVELSELTPRPLPIPDSTAVLNNPQLEWYRQQITVAEKEKSVEKNLMAPDLTFGFFSQTLIGTPTAENSTALATKSDRFQGFQVGISFPLWFRPQTARVKAAEYNRLSTQSRYQQEQRNYKGELTSLSQEVSKLGNSLTYYTSSGLPQAKLILKQSNLAFRGGEIGYVEYIQALNTAADLRAGYLETLNNYNQAVINLEYLLGQR
ncbi:MAG: hypothetical protein C0490_07870 [Marivirga sp.]|nr:hypothetical protein [Marivirga sp.]